MESRHIHWTKAMDAMLGSDHDITVAAHLGISRDSVQARRKTLGVPRYEGHRQRTRTCAQCGGTTGPRPPKALGPFYCSGTCMRAARQGKAKSPRPCKVDGCSDSARARGMCPKHYVRIKKGLPIDLPDLVQNAGHECVVDDCTYTAYCKGLCTLHYGRLRSHGDPLREPPTFEERFWVRVDRSAGSDACWPWTGTESEGYGHVASEPGHAQTRAHVVAWRLTYGRPVPVGKHLDHTCHTADPACPAGAECLHRRCCNPAHLEPVTVGENNRRSWQRKLDGATCGKGHTRDRDGQGRCLDCRNDWERGYRRNGKRVTRVPDSVKAVVIARCQGLCEGCGHGLDTRARTHFHHRKSRAQGGQNTADNIVALHSTCHVVAPEAVHQRPAWARSHGLIVVRGDDPGSTPLVLGSGRRVLLDSLAPRYIQLHDVPYAV